MAIRSSHVRNCDFLAKLAQVLDHAHEGLLGDLLGILVLLDDPAGNAKDLPLVFHQERFHGREIARLGLLDQRAIVIALGLPLLTQRAAQSLVQRGRQVISLFGLEELDRLPDVVDHDLAWIAAAEMFLERAANARVQLAVHVMVQRGKQFFTFHGFSPAGSRSASVNVRPEPPF